MNTQKLLFHGKMDELPFYCPVFCDYRNQVPINKISEMENRELDITRHSAAHVLATAAIRLFPETKIGIGPVNGSGFYYDFEFPRTISAEDLKYLETEMNQIIQADLPFTQIVVPKEEGFDILLRRGQIYKSELLRELPDPEVSFFKTGDEFIDLCRGPHVASTGMVGVVKLTKIEDVHWKGDTTRPRLQRIHGISFPTLDRLHEYVKLQEQINNRDFRILSKNLQLNLGTNKNVVYTPGGAHSLKQIQRVVEEQLGNRGYSEIICPPVTDLDYSIAPLDQYFDIKNRSYKELPVRVFYSSRNELEVPAQITGRDYHSVSTVTAKSYFNPSERYAELNNSLELVSNIISQLHERSSALVRIPGTDYEPASQLAEILQRKGISQVLVVTPGLSGMSVDIIATDSLQREWPVMQLEYSEEGHKYISKQGEVTDAASISFSFVVDNTLAFYIEDEEGLLPLWLAPVQVIIIPISDIHLPYSERIEKLLAASGIRTQIDARSETMQARIRSAELLKIPVIAIIGEKEAQNNSVSLRMRNQKEIGMVSEPELAETIFSLYS